MKDTYSAKSFFASASIFTATLFSTSAIACSVIPQNSSFSLDDFTSKVTSTIEFEDSLSLRLNGECSGSINISFPPRELITMEEEPTIFIASTGNPLFNSIVGGINSATVKIPEGNSFASIPLRLVADVSLATHHSDIARSIDMNVEIIDDAGVLVSASTESLALIEGTNPTYFESTPAQMVGMLNITDSEEDGVITRSVSPLI